MTGIRSCCSTIKSAFATLVAALFCTNTAFAELQFDTPDLALTGRVSSSQEGAMGGVLVSAQRSGSPISVTVVTNETGRYSFPSDRLPPGHYALRIRAVGYELDGPAAVDVAAKGTVTADLKLHQAADIASQLTSTEWLMSMPGGPEQKRALIEFKDRHTLERIVRSKFTADEFVGVLKRMANYANNSTMQKVQARVAEREVPDDRARRVG